MASKFKLAVFLTLLGTSAMAQTRTAPAMVESVAFDWSHSGSPTRFSLYFRGINDSLGDADRLAIRIKDRSPWAFDNKDDEWGPVASDEMPGPAKKNLIASRRLFFVAAGDPLKSRIYLLLKGGGYGCCVGSLTVLTPDSEGTPKVVFHASEHLLRDVVALPDGSGIMLIGQSTDSEARATKNAESYEPFCVYILEGDKTARYDEERSRRYTQEKYCEWAGPSYNEKFVAVNIDSGKFGAGHCRTMTEGQFTRYYEQHKSHFE
jgi:hypothetical protein